MQAIKEIFCFWFGGHEMKLYQDKKIEHGLICIKCGQIIDTNEFIPNKANLKDEGWG